MLHYWFTFYFYVTLITAMYTVSLKQPTPNIAPFWIIVSATITSHRPLACALGSPGQPSDLIVETGTPPATPLLWPFQPSGDSQPASGLPRLRFVKGRGTREAGYVTIPQCFEVDICPWTLEWTKTNWGSVQGHREHTGTEPARADLPCVALLACAELLCSAACVDARELGKSWGPNHRR